MTPEGSGAATEAAPSHLATDDFVRLDVVDRVGWITLDRPRALNALTLPMVSTLRDGLTQWGRREDLRAVVIESSSDRAFCAGGDIRAVREQSLTGQHDANVAFFATEYAVNQQVAELPQPYVALLDGVCMGGGLGLSVHGTVRVVTERATLAMPETGIGFLPDVGATWFLPRLPGALGMFLGLTGQVVSPTDAVQCGLATHLVPSDRLAELRSALRAGDEAIEGTVARFAVDVDTPGPLGEQREVIDECFSAASVDDVFERLAADGGAWARSVEAALRRRSPWSTYVTFALLRVPAASLAKSLERELRVVTALTRTDDFLEGVRSVLVDRDRNPAWASSWGAQTARAVHRWLHEVTSG